MARISDVASYVTGVYLCWLLALGLVASELHATPSPLAAVAQSSGPNAVKPLDGVLLFWADPSHQADLTTSQDWMSLLDKYPFATLPDGKESLGYRRDTAWILLTPAMLRTGWPVTLLSLDYPLIDYIDLYQWQRTGWEVVSRTGDKRDFTTREHEHRNFVWTLNDTSAPLLMRLRTDGSLMLKLSLRTPSNLISTSQRTNLLYGMLLGAIAIMLLYNLFLYLLIRQPFYFYYVAMMFFVLLYQMSMLGYGYQFLWRDDGTWINEHVQPVTIGAMLGFIGLFVRDALLLKREQPLHYRVLNWEIKLGFTLSLCGFVLPLWSLIHITSILPMVIVVHVMAIGVMALRSRLLAARVFIAAWGGALLGGLLFALQQLGVLPPNPFSEHGFQVGLILNVVLLSFVLVAHINQLKAEKAQAEEKAVENYRMALHDGLTGVPNRRAFDFHFHNEFRRALREREHLSLLMIDIDYFKLFNDSYGHKRADDVLVRLGVAMRGCLARPTDSLYRYGGEEFAVVLADTDLDGAVHIADMLRARIAGLAIEHRGSPFKQVTVSIGVATLLDINAGAFGLLEQADAALYQAKNAGRNRYYADRSGEPDAVVAKMRHTDQRAS